jgi:hypothetical protein
VTSHLPAAQRLQPLIVSLLCGDNENPIALLDPPWLTIAKPYDQRYSADRINNSPTR